MADIFISYSSADRDVATRLADLFHEFGYSVWWDRNIPVGRSFSEVIAAELDSARCVVVLWSAASVASDWVVAEAAEGAARKILIPIQIGPARLPLEFRRLQTAMLTGWNGEKDHRGITDCLAAMSSLMGRPAGEARAPRTAPAPPPVRGRIGPVGISAIIIVMLTAIWLGGVTFHVGGSLVHILLLAALIVAAWKIAPRLRKTV